MQSLRNLVAGKRYGVRDLIGILLALAIGISGQLFLADPLKILAPSLPMLSPAGCLGDADRSLVCGPSAG